VIHHSDQGSQYTSIAFGLRCKEASVRPSMGSVGDAYDNAMCESFFATLECELFDRRKFRTKAEARMAIFQFIEGWYNPGRRHSAIGYQSPIDYERRAQERLESASPQLSTEPGELQLQLQCLWRANPPDALHKGAPRRANDQSLV
jgi:putative transposase